MKEKSVYFPNLNSLRFIAALLVIIHHIEQVKLLFKLENSFFVPPFELIGKMGVVLFFALSGFLITYLLMAEKEFTGIINIPNFYIRRILRIWPLYFLITGLALFLMPKISLFTFPDYPETVVHKSILAKILLYVVLLPNLVMSTFGFVPYAAQTWSVGVEEQFYAFWPWLMKYVKNRYFFMISIILAYILGDIVLTQLQHYPLPGKIRNLYLLTPIDCMAIGGLYSLVCYNTDSFSNKLRWFLFNRVTQMLNWVILIGLVGNGIKFEYLHNEIYAILFGNIIANLALNPSRIINLEFGWINYLGKISYGLYMYHMIAIVLVINLLPSNLAVNNWIVYPASLLSSIFIAGISYQWFEKPFIAMKGKFTSIISGDQAKEGKH